MPHTLLSIRFSPALPDALRQETCIIALMFRNNDRAFSLPFAVPPAPPEIRVAQTGESVSVGTPSSPGVLGPYSVGAKLDLVCVVRGGKKRRWRW